MNANFASYIIYFDAQDYDPYNKYNDSLMNRFSQFMGNLCVMTHSHKGSFWYKIVYKSSCSNESRYKFHDDPECTDCYGEGTVDIILDMLRSLRDSYAQCRGNGKCFIRCGCNTHSGIECSCVNGYSKNRNSCIIHPIVP